MSEMKFSSVSAIEDINCNKDDISLYKDTNSDKVIETEASKEKESKSSVQINQSKSRGNPLNEVELKFELNRDTDQLTVFVVDKTSKSVLRTIPPEELADLDAGDLLEIAA